MNVWIQGVTLAFSAFAADPGVIVSGLFCGAIAANADGFDAGLSFDPQRQNVSVVVCDQGIACRRVFVGPAEALLSIGWNGGDLIIASRQGVLVEEEPTATPDNPWPRARVLRDLHGRGGSGISTSPLRFDRSRCRFEPPIERGLKP